MKGSIEPKFPKIDTATRIRLESGHVHIWWGSAYWGALQGAYCPVFGHLDPHLMFAVLDACTPVPES